MKTKKIISSFVLFIGFLLVQTSCKDEFYTIDDKFYDGMEIVVKNELIDGVLHIEQYNTDKLLIEELTNPELVLDSKAFIYTVEHDSILKIEDDGNLLPQSIGQTKVDIVFRANSNLRTSIIVDVYKDYHPVEYLMASSAVGNLLIEKGYTLNLAPYIFVFPAHADNKTLHFSLDEPSKAFASITDEGVITGIAQGTINVHIVSDENPNANLDVSLNIVDEIEITDLLLNPKLDGITMGLDERINLNKVFTILPSNVNERNRTLSYNIVSGSDVVRIDVVNNQLITIGGGTAVIEVITKNEISKEFTIHVDPEIQDLTRTFWEVETSILYGTGLNYVVDGATGKPEDMFDDNGATFLSLVKPGKTFSGSTGPEGTLNYFVVDMQVETKFNSLRWNHRSNHASTYLRVWGIKMEGSNDGENWEIINENIELPNTKGAADGNDTKRYDIALGAEYEYRYVKVTLTKWSDNSGGSTSGSTMQIGEFGLSNL